MLVGIKSDYHVITDQVPVIFSSPVRGMYIHVYVHILVNLSNQALANNYVILVKNVQ